MRVQYNFKDDFGRYDIQAEVSHTGRVALISIKDEYGTEIDVEDFSEDEKKQIGFLAKEAADELEGIPDKEMDDDY